MRILSGKNAIVTGGSKGIGKSVCLALILIKEILPHIDLVKNCQALTMKRLQPVSIL